MSPRLKLAAAATTLIPEQQGILDSLCGLYAIINACQLVLYPVRLTRPQRVQLFETGVAFLGSKRWLRRSLVAGMSEEAWLPLCERVVAEAVSITGAKIKALPVTARLPSSADDMLRAVRRCLKAGQPVIICLEGRLIHWTVAARFSTSRLILFDSGGRSWVQLAAFHHADGHPAQIITAAVALRRCA